MRHRPPPLLAAQPVPVRESGPWSAAAQTPCWPASACSPFQASVRWWRPSWLIATLAGAGVGATAGWLARRPWLARASARAMRTSMPRAFERGGTLVTVRADDALAVRINDLMESESRVVAGERRTAYESGRLGASRPGSVPARSRRDRGRAAAVSRAARFDCEVCGRWQISPPSACRAQRAVPAASAVV